MEPTNIEYYALLKEVAHGNNDAFEYLLLMSKVFRTLDDLYDKDAEVKSEVANECFAALGFDLSRNKFFVDNRQALEAFAFIAWNAWMDANTWHGHEDRVKGLCAWFIRDWCNEIDALVAWLVGGSEHARAMSLKCREFYLKQLVSRGTDGFFGS